MNASSACRDEFPSMVSARTHEVIAKPRPHVMSTIEAFLIARLISHVTNMMITIVIAATAIALPMNNTPIAICVSI